MPESSRPKFATAEEIESYLRHIYSDVDDYDIEIVRHFKDRPRKKRGAWSIFVWTKGGKNLGFENLRAAFRADAA